MLANFSTRHSTVLEGCRCCQLCYCVLCICTFLVIPLYDTWVLNGPPGTMYNRSPSGWFTREIFEDWFSKIVLPYFRRCGPGPKVLLGDNLGSHISFEIIHRALQENIRFILRPPNSTHLTQPLDVSVFRPLKQSWRAVLEEWKLKNKGVMQKPIFPYLLKSSIEKTKNMRSNIVSGFRSTGVYQFDPTQVLKRLPVEEDEAEIGARMLSPMIELLKANRFRNENRFNPGRKKKITTPAGRSVALTILLNQVTRVCQMMMKIWIRLIQKLVAMRVIVMGMK